MKEKKLYSSAIIPNDLYVQRDADRKLREVVSRMSKPAYISVARQMGKTNLLIQTKRALQDDDNRYIYIDITSDFNTSQDCFRYIVNQILDSNEDIDAFQEAKRNILISRKDVRINPSEEYQNEIRQILKHYKGKIVVFLDEVDDLRKHGFSDDIFGQIRKTYFINETYPVLKRVTYILSGVIDPEKLIKTKENSPFNIAIPIYLEDFNKIEFYTLMEKSDLIIEDSIKDYIFDWLKGNPRMSFEILSLIEDELIKGKIINEEVVDKIINDFYLTTFKNPPIDHIRDLVSQNSDIRKAIIKLKNGEIDEISDEIINRLYLFGITASKIDKRNLKIKNKVLEISLSDEWLENIEFEKKGYYEYGEEKIQQGKILEGIELLKEYIDNEPEGQLVSLAKYSIGKAYNTIGNFELSNDYLSKRPVEKEKHTELYYWQIFYAGINYLKLAKLEESIILFDEIITDSKIPQVVINAFINKGESCINLGKIEKEFIIDNYIIALEYLEQNSAKILEKNFLQAVIYFRLGYLKFQVSQKNEAKVFFEKALEFAKDDEKTSILLYLHNCYLDDLSKIKQIYLQLYELIINNELLFTDGVDKVMGFREPYLNIILSNLIEFKLFQEFESLSTYSILKLYKEEKNESDLWLELAIFCFRNKEFDSGEYLIDRILNKDIDDYLRLRCYRVLGIMYNNQKKYKLAVSYLDKYVNLFDSNKNFNNELMINDFDAFMVLIHYYYRLKEFDKGFHYSLLFEKYFNENLSPENKANSLIVYFYIMDFYRYSGDTIKSHIYGDKIISIVAEVRPVSDNFSYIDKKTIDSIEEQTILYIRNIKPLRQEQSVKLIREPGRNEIIKVRYRDGKEMLIKYKKVSGDIRTGKCFIIT